MLMYDTYEEAYEVARRDPRGQYITDDIKTVVDIIISLFEKAYNTKLYHDDGMKGRSFIGRSPLYNKYYHLGVMYNDPGDGALFGDHYLIYKENNIKTLSICVTFDGKYLYVIPAERLRDVVKSVKWQINLSDYIDCRVEI